MKLTNFLHASLVQNLDHQKQKKRKFICFTTSRQSPTTVQVSCKKMIKIHMMGLQISNEADKFPPSLNYYCTLIIVNKRRKFICFTTSKQSPYYANPNIKPCIKTFINTTHPIEIGQVLHNKPPPICFLQWQSIENFLLLSKCLLGESEERKPSKKYYIEGPRLSSFFFSPSSS